MFYGFQQERIFHVVFLIHITSRLFSVMIFNKVLVILRTLNIFILAFYDKQCTAKAPLFLLRFALLQFLHGEG